MDWEIRNKNILLWSILVIDCFQIMGVTPQIIDCARLMMKVAKGVLKVYGGCAKDFMQSLGDDQREYQRRVDCVMKCVMGKIGLVRKYWTDSGLDDWGKVTNDTMQVFFDQFIPEDYHEIGQIMVEGCIEEYSPMMDNEDGESEDDTCMPYGEFVKCVQGIVAEAC